jgi:hypothetical protein
MQSPHQSVPASPETSSAAPMTARSRDKSREDLIYQAVTVAAILLLIASVWIF